MESVILSAYRIATPFTLRAARPDGLNSGYGVSVGTPSLSASRMATRETSGRSRPSRRRLMPTSTS